MKKKLKKLIRLNIFFTSAMILGDLLIVHHHTNDNQDAVRQVSASNQMRIRKGLKTVHADEEFEHSDD
ncbi:hypothetical protein COSHB9_02450 [Companilactobacillus alimentarius]|uniref:Uncharacterized protein n=1 Tax=Companilactobacillus alimentarius DSM 20249 TaxID=1423720 RepID=A0A2K9HG44_9LACO|nr:hypothetical protein [Companilactobacillus alimentarius]AUI71348.1 hypothetical protein LA20249_03675 [Companilactobacillus alimentarius DSM 20249]MDT6951331.1 hypothetical protein [Companilactobacillus alimentarius]GEO44331.1 hypothetical protein LAL01_05630 [Companilactobacillus alimentarius]